MNAPPTAAVAFALFESGRLDESARAWREILAQRPDDTEALHMLGYILAETGRTDEGLALVDRSIANAPRNAGLRSNRAAILARVGRHGDAMRDLRRAIDLDPRLPAPFVLLGQLHAAAGRIDEAVAAYRRAIALDPRHVTVLNDLAVLLRRGGHEAEARALLDRAIALEPSNPDVLNNLGISLQRAGLTGEAIARFRAACEARPAFAGALVNWGNVLQDRMELEAARERYEEALRASPGWAEARYGLAQVALRQRRFEAGWDLYEARFETRPPFSLARELPIARLEAESLSRARRVAVWSEQGLGDQLLYSTLLPELARRGIGAVVEVDPRLLAAYRRSLPAIEFTTPAESAGAFAQCDFHIPIASLPRIFRRDAASFDSQPRALLTADPARAAAIRAQLGAGRWIGIAWCSLQKGEREAVARGKSIPLEAFGALAQVEGVRLVDLQYGDHELREERARFDALHPFKRAVVPHLDTRDDLEGVLAAIAACEQVVTSSNALAHLAGALGQPTTVVLPGGREPFHYWVRADGGRSPWYPSVKVAGEPRLQ